MNNEPVAWIVRTFDADKGKTVEAIWDFKPMNTIGCTPLYTHPAKPIDKPDECINGCPKNQTCDYCAGITTLTDEEIMQIACDEFYGIIKKQERPAFIRFAKALFKKINE